MSAKQEQLQLEKLETGIPGFDLISYGGLPKGRPTLISGTAGSAKTVIACQFLAEGIIQAGENGVFVTFEESPQDIRRNVLGLNWDIQEWERDGKWSFVDASPQPEEEAIVLGDYDLGALTARIEHAIRKVDAKRLSMDSIGAIVSQFADSTIVRRELLRITSALKKMGVTSILTAERGQEYGDITRFGVEEFVADNVIILRNVLQEEKRRRTMEILKFRGASHQKGEFPFTLVQDQGIIVLPLSAIELKRKSSDRRTTSGNLEMDRMCGGGFLRNSITLVSGATGNGKTLMTSEFLAGGANNGDRCLAFAFEESQEQLFRNATCWGINFAQMEKEGKLKVVCQYPEVTGLEDHLVKIKSAIDEFKPNRVTVDSLSALERISTIKGFHEFIIGLASFLKQNEIVSLFTAVTPTLIGGTSITEAHISTITDSIILLRYVEMFGEMHRCITVLKMRGSRHDTDIREFTIDGQGMHIGKPLRNVSGILTGTPQHIVTSELERIDALFEGGGGSDYGSGKAKDAGGG